MGIGVEGSKTVKPEIKNGCYIGDMTDADVIVIGAGMAGLTAACKLALAGRKVLVLEQNYLPGGCTSSYWRKGFVFEAGATTVVGLDEGMPLAKLLKDCQIEVPAQKLPIAMKVHRTDGFVMIRWTDLDDWISEAEAFFGPAGQAPFWRACKSIADFVWTTSLQQLQFPPQTVSDLLACVRGLTWAQIKHLPFAFKTTDQLLKQYGLDQNPDFVNFVNEQLMITAQNTAEEVNALFGATALCYTMLGNYYVPGGLLELVTPMVNYVERKHGKVLMRHPVKAVTQTTDGWQVSTPKQTFTAKEVIFAIPLNNVVELLPSLAKRYRSQTMASPQLASAFQIGIGYRPNRPIDSLHHQVHLKESLAAFGVGHPDRPGSIFISFSHPDDRYRADEPGLVVANVSTHVFDPERHAALDKGPLVEAILARLAAADLIMPDNIVYLHASDPADWAKWTGRKWGFVGGYPQFSRIKPWQMVGHRLPLKGAYLCGDTTYPGQGIPGACLSGLIVAEKMLG